MQVTPKAFAENPRRRQETTQPTPKFKSILCNMKIVVTGAAGFIGSHTVERILKAGHEVLGIDSLRTGKLANTTLFRSNSSFALQILDIVAERRKFEAYVSAFKPDAILHLAALVSVPESIKDPELNYNLNIQTTHIIAESARRLNIPRVVFASSAAVYGDAFPPDVTKSTMLSPKSPYGVAKLCSELILNEYSRSYKITTRNQRYFNVYGERQDPSSGYSGVLSVFMQRAQKRESITVYGDGLQTRDFIAVRDVAEANLRALTERGLDSGSADICSGKYYSLNNIIEIIRGVTGLNIHVDYLKPRDGDIRVSCGNPCAAKKDFGFQPSVELEEGLRDYWRYLNRKKD